MISRIFFLTFFFFQNISPFTTFASNFSYATDFTFILAPLFRHGNCFFALKDLIYKKQNKITFVYVGCVGCLQIYTKGAAKYSALPRTPSQPKKLMFPHSVRFWEVVCALDVFFFSTSLIQIKTKNVSVLGVDVLRNVVFEVITRIYLG